MEWSVPRRLLCLNKSSEFCFYELAAPEFGFYWSGQSDLQALNRYTLVTQAETSEGWNCWAIFRFKAMELSSQMTYKFVPGVNKAWGIKPGQQMSSFHEAQALTHRPEFFGHSMSTVFDSFTKTTPRQKWINLWVYSYQVFYNILHILIFLTLNTKSTHELRKTLKCNPFDETMKIYIESTFHLSTPDLVQDTSLQSPGPPSVRTGLWFQLCTYKYTLTQRKGRAPPTVTWSCDCDAGGGGRPLRWVSVYL